MDDEKLKYQIGANIAAYRKRAGLTQVGLAEKLNYSDKAVSKWERGESVPDVLTLMQLAAQFDITVNDLLVDPEALPGNPGTLEKAMTQVSEKALKRKANKNVILAAHGNSLRALSKYIENISDEDIMNLEMATGQPVVYDFDEKLNVLSKEKY